MLVLTPLLEAVGHCAVGERERFQNPFVEPFN